MKEEKLMSKLILKSNSFENEGQLPEKFTCDGDNMSPELQWSGVPQNSNYFALIFEKLDEDNRAIVHWIVVNIESDLSELPEDAILDEFPHALELLNDFNVNNYLGPCPEKDFNNKYRFTLFALENPVTIEGPFTRDWFAQFYKDNILAEAQLFCEYKRK